MLWIIRGLLNRRERKARFARPWLFGAFGLIIVAFGLFALVMAWTDYSTAAGAARRFEREAAANRGTDRPTRDEVETVSAVRTDDGTTLQISLLDSRGGRYLAIFDASVPGAQALPDKLHNGDSVDVRLLNNTPVRLTTRDGWEIQPQGTPEAAASEKRGGLFGALLFELLGLYVVMRCVLQIVRFE